MLRRTLVVAAAVAVALSAAMPTRHLTHTHHGHAKDGSIALAVNQTSGLAHHDWVTVTFGGVAPADREGCWLGLFASGANLSAVWPLPVGSTYGWMPYTASAPIKFLACSNADANFNATGAGTHAFELLNMRVPLFFALFTGGDVTPLAQARTPDMTFANPAQPLHVHLALTERPDEVLVQWTSLAPEPQAVAFTVNGGPAQVSAPSLTSTFGADDMCGAPANREGWFEPGVFHRARVTGLRPGDAVAYRVGSDAVGWSAEYTFAGPILPGAPSVRLLVTADVGATEPDNTIGMWTGAARDREMSSLTTLQHVADALPADAILHIGDLAYAVGYEAKWELFMDQMEAAGARAPYMTGMGNHERDWPGTGTVGEQDSGGECGTPTQHRFTMPVPSRKQESGWYSFSMGPVHVIMLFTELPCGQGSSQYDFLAADLAAVDRSVTPWVVIGGHRPMYWVMLQGSLGPDTSDNFCHGAADLEPLFAQYEVDLALWGHVHNTLVTCPVYNGTCGTKNTNGFAGTVHAVIGNGGQELSGLPPVTPPWQAYAGNDFGWSFIEANATDLTMTLVHDADNTVEYSFALHRDQQQKQ